MPLTPTIDMYGGGDGEIDNGNSSSGDSYHDDYSSGDGSSVKFAHGSLIRAE